MRESFRVPHSAFLTASDLFLLQISIRFHTIKVLPAKQGLYINEGCEFIIKVQEMLPSASVCTSKRMELKSRAWCQPQPQWVSYTDTSRAPASILIT